MHDDESLPEHSVMMASLRNKNKKRGFKNSMASPLPLKIIFANGMDNTSGLDAQTALPFAATEPDFEFISVPRLIPPSEKQDKGMLPANMFVTSIDVENGARQKNNRKKSCEAVTEEGWLDYGQEDVQDAPIAVDFTAAESGWDDLIRVTDSAQLSSGQTVGWKVRLAISSSARIYIYIFAHRHSHSTLQRSRQKCLSTSPVSSNVIPKKLLFSLCLDLAPSSTTGKT